MMLGSVNALQIIISMAMFNINFPPNAEFLYSILGNIVTFNIVPMQTIEQVLFNFTNTNSEAQYYNMDIF